MLQVVDLQGLPPKLENPAAFIPEESVRIWRKRARFFSFNHVWWRVGPDFRHPVSDRLSSQRATEDGRRGELYISLYRGKAWLYISLYIYIVDHARFLAEGPDSCCFSAYSSCPGRVIVNTDSLQEWGPLDSGGSRWRSFLPGWLGVSQGHWWWAL